MMLSSRGNKRIKQLRTRCQIGRGMYTKELFMKLCLLVPVPIMAILGVADQAEIVLLEQ